MISRRAEQCIWITTSLIALGVIPVLNPFTREANHTGATIPRALDGSATRRLTSTPRVRIDTAVREIIAANVFRHERHAAEVAAQAIARPVAVRPAAPSRPRLVLRGLVGGPPWDAIIEGIPGHEGSYVVRAGDSIGGLRIHSVHRDGAVIRGMDTTWTLRWGRAP